MVSVKLIVVSIAIVLAVSFHTLYPLLFQFDPYAPMTTYTVGDGVHLKVGIMSDSQLIEKADSTRYNYTDNLIKGFEVFKSHDVDAIIFAGDIILRNRICFYFI